MNCSRHALDALLKPKSIAIVGVSRDPSRQTSINGSAVLESLTRFGYPGRIDLIHPEAREMGGRVLFPSIAALTESPDLIVLSLAAAAIPQAIEEAGARGIRGAVVMSAGFSELGAGEGTLLEAQMKTAAARHSLRICGPNGLGYINVPGGIYAGYYPCLGTAAPKPGGLAIVTHSGAVGNSLLARAVDRGVGFSYVVSAGNETNVTLADYIDFLVDDANTRVIALYMEGVVDGLPLRRALERAAGANKPVVIYKVGKSAAGATAALSHTAKVAGEPLLYRGLFRQLGVIEAQCLDDLVEIPMLLLKSARHAAITPKAIGVVTISGGLGAIMADHFSAEGFALPVLAASTQAALSRLPLKFGSVANPVDTTAAIQRTERTLADIIRAVAGDPGIDAVVFPNASRFSQRAVDVAHIMRDTAERIDKPLLSVWYAGSDNDAAMKLLHDSDEVACYDDPSACARALAALRDVRQFANRKCATPVAPPPGAKNAARAIVTKAGLLSEPEAKEVLRHYGVKLPRESVARDAAHAVELAEWIGFPVALKVVSPTLAHKARAGGVQLGIQSADAVRSACAQIFADVARLAPDVVIEGILVSEMVVIKSEFLAGSYRDAHLGPVFVVGIGGGQVEAIRDVAMRLLPVTADDCRSALDELQDRSARLLDSAEKDALVSAFAQIAAMAWDLGPVLSELDVNPVALSSTGKAVALDVMMALAGAAI